MSILRVIDERDTESIDTLSILANGRFLASPFTVKQDENIAVVIRRTNNFEKYFILSPVKSGLTNI
jgi:hypothetical protein